MMERASISGPSQIRASHAQRRQSTTGGWYRVGDTENQITIELEANARKPHKQAQAVEERWRTAHGFDTKRAESTRRAEAPNGSRSNVVWSADARNGSGRELSGRCWRGHC